MRDIAQSNELGIARARSPRATAIHTTGSLAHPRADDGRAMMPRVTVHLDRSSLPPRTRATSLRMKRSIGGPSPSVSDNGAREIQCPARGHFATVAPFCPTARVSGKIHFVAPRHGRFESDRDWRSGEAGGIDKKSDQRCDIQHSQEFWDVVSSEPDRCGVTTEQQICQSNQHARSHKVRIA
jgi:hypothetical protein